MKRGRRAKGLTKATCCACARVRACMCVHTHRYADMKRAKANHRLVEEVHALSAGLKAYTTAFTQKTLSTCREACGGHGTW